MISGTGGTGSGIKVSVVVANGSATINNDRRSGGYTDNDTITLSRTGTYGASDITVNVNGVGATATFQWQVVQMVLTMLMFQQVLVEQLQHIPQQQQVFGDNGKSEMCGWYHKVQHP